MKSHSSQNHQDARNNDPRTARNTHPTGCESGHRADASRVASRHGRCGAAGHARPSPRTCRMSRRSLALADLKLAQIEDAFLDMLLDAHPRRTTALDRLLADVDAAGPVDAHAMAAVAVPVPDAAVAAASSRRIESALLGAVIQRHPRRDAALDRLLGDLDLSPAAPEAAHGAWVDEEERRRAEFDLACDNDFDGLG